MRAFFSKRSEPPRVAIFMSGSGSNAEKLLDSLASKRFRTWQPVAVVTDAPETSRAAAIAAKWNLPLVEHDIKRFYSERGEARVSLKTEKGRSLREAWTNELRSHVAPFNIDFGVLAGFVTLTNITSDFPCLNVHPGDLTVKKDGRRFLIGLHERPVELAILEGHHHLRSSVIAALTYEGKGDDMDSGPILGLSPAVAVNRFGFSLSELRECLKARPSRRPRGGYGDDLETVARRNLESLKRGGDWEVFPPVVADFAAGRFALDDDGSLLFRLNERWTPVRAVEYATDQGVQPVAR